MRHHVVRFVAALFLAVAGVVVLSACSRPSVLNLRCVVGDLQRCRQLGDMYAAGNGVPQDFARAATLYERVCEAGVSDVCNTLAQIYEHVPGFETESAKVPVLYERACTLGSAHGCVNLGVVEADQEEFQKAATLFERGCVDGAFVGCYHLGLAFENGEGVDKDMAHAVALFEQACHAQHVESCDKLVTLFTEGTEIEKDVPRATQYNADLLQIYTDACDAGSDRDCRDRDRIKTRMALQAAAGK